MIACSESALQKAVSLSRVRWASHLTDPVQCELCLALYGAQLRTVPADNLVGLLLIREISTQGFSDRDIADLSSNPDGVGQRLKVVAEFVQIRAHFIYLNRDSCWIEILILAHKVELDVIGGERALHASMPVSNRLSKLKRDPSSLGSLRPSLITALPKRKSKGHNHCAHGSDCRKCFPVHIAPLSRLEPILP